MNDSAETTDNQNENDSEKKTENVKELLKERKQQQLKKKKKIAGGVVLVVIILIWFAMQPLRAGINYGICKTFLETDVKYPTSLNITQYDEYGPSIRIFYTYTDGYGGSRAEMIECIVSPDPANGYAMRNIKIDREPIEKEALERFNLSIPGIIAGDPDLTIPPPYKGDLLDLKRD